jgi:2-polyprenyl-3-methyl-5-hydroxy-6-metoxy-1,4-benzoquinol methylase
VSFYDELAGQYDTLVAQQQREQTVEDFADRLLERYGIEAAVDAACGTGLYARALARRGVDVTGIDLSKAMLVEARASDENVRWVHGAMQDLAGRLTENGFDAVLCMGNSLPHVLTRPELHSTFEGFARVLRPGGVAIVHLLNYTKVLTRRERIVGITRSGDREFVRFYDFTDPTVQFNALRIDWSTTPPGHELHATTLLPWQENELAAAFRSAGLDPIETFGDLNFGPFVPDESDVLMVTARAPSS